jgi:hypothetical protein
MCFVLHLYYSLGSHIVIIYDQVPRFAVEVHR